MNGEGAGVFRIDGNLDAAVPGVAGALCDADVALFECDRGATRYEEVDENLVIRLGVDVVTEQRQQARADKEWAESDRIRDELAGLGWVVKDTPEGPKLQKASS